MSDGQRQREEPLPLPNFLSVSAETGVSSARSWRDRERLGLGQGLRKDVSTSSRSVELETLIRESQLRRREESWPGQLLRRLRLGDAVPSFFRGIQVHP